MTRKAPLLVCWLLLLALLGLPACGRGESSDPDSSPRIALVMKTLNNPFFIDMHRGAQDAAARLGVRLIAQAAERELDVEKQMQIIENLIQMRVEAICVTPSGSREIIPAIAKANRAGIPVLVIDTRVDSEAARREQVQIETFIGSDNYEGGRIAGEHLVRTSPEGARVIVLEGIPGHETGDSRLRGFRDAIREVPGIQVVASQPANWERDQGYNVCQNLLQAHPDIDVVFACNDMMALGALEAIAAAGRTGRIRVLGFDAIEEARRAIQAGTLEASIAQFPYEMGREAVENAARVVRGEKLPPEILVRIELITVENAAAVGQP